jgi:hypothetical protein
MNCDNCRKLARDIDTAGHCGDCRYIMRIGAAFAPYSLAELFRDGKKVCDVRPVIFTNPSSQDT